MRNSQTVTGEKAYWMVPTNAPGDNAMLPLRDIDFTSAKTKKIILESAISSVQECPSTSHRTSRKSNPSTQDELHELFSTLSTCTHKAAILAVLPGISHQLKPRSLCKDFPNVLTNLFQPCRMHLTIDELIIECEQINIEVSQEQIYCVEQETRSQCKNPLWFKFRVGRITASLMKRVCKTDPDKPSQSLVKQICYPELIKFTSKATQWGCNHENVALDFYTSKTQVHHENFMVEDCGFCISHHFPHIGASPDAIVQCDCCGKGCVEIKYPYCTRDKCVLDNSLVLSISDEKVELRKDHAYFYQIQTQLLVTDLEYCDFVL